jgi:hypothetical protein
LNVLISSAFIKASVALALTLGPFLTTSAFAQSPAAEDPKPENPQAVTAAASASAQQASGAAAPTNDERYKDGIVIWETPADAKVPFLLGKLGLATVLDPEPGGHFRGET